MTATQIESFIAEIEGELAGHMAGDSATRLIGLLERALPYVKAALPTEANGEFEQAVLASYHKHFPNSPKVLKMSGARRANLRGRVRDSKERAKPEWWETFFKFAARSDFLSGRRSNNRGWRPDFDFFMQPSRLIRVLEGHYHEQTGKEDFDSYVDGVVNEHGARMKKTGSGD